MPPKTMQCAGYFLLLTENPLSRVSLHLAMHLLQMQWPVLFHRSRKQLPAPSDLACCQVHKMHIVELLWKIQISNVELTKMTPSTNKGLTQVIMLCQPLIHSCRTGQLQQATWSARCCMTVHVTCRTTWSVCALSSVCEWFVFPCLQQKQCQYHTERIVNQFQNGITLPSGIVQCACENSSCQENEIEIKYTRIRAQILSNMMNVIQSINSFVRKASLLVTSASQIWMFDARDNEIFSPGGWRELSTMEGTSVGYTFCRNTACNVDRPILRGHNNGKMLTRVLFWKKFEAFVSFGTECRISFKEINRSREKMEKETMVLSSKQASCTF